MRKRVDKLKLSRQKTARLALAKNLAKALILSGKIQTTKPRAKFAQRYVEKLVCLTKKDTLASRREIFARLSNKKIGQKLISEIGPKFTKVSSGFTRVVTLEARRGDAATLALLEFAFPPEIKKSETIEKLAGKKQSDPHLPESRQDAKKTKQ